MGLRTTFVTGFARQLGRPTGLAGRLVSRMLNRSNLPMMRAAIDALELRPGSSAADVGFGGGRGLDLLLRQVGEHGQVHGVDVSPLAVARARSRFRAAVAAERLRLHEGSLTELPLADSSVDGLITVNTLYFVAELDRAGRELARVVTDTGRIAVCIGDPDFMAGLPFTAHGFRLRPVAEVVATLTAAGLDVTDHRRVGNSDRAAHLLLCRR